MAGFADLVRRGQPALAETNIEGATEGRTWLWEFELLDDAGDAIDVTTVTSATCKVLDSVGGGTVVELDFTGGVGTFSVGLDEADTVGLANGIEKRRCRWSLVVVKDGHSVQFVSPVESHFIIWPEG